jgi:hypothetical protein
MAHTLVIQSHRTPLPAHWMERTIDSVKTWAALRHFDYCFLGDELLDVLPQDLLNGSGPFLDLFLEHARHPIAAVNLCGSLTANGEMSDEEVSGVIDILLSGISPF